MNKKKMIVVRCDYGRVPCYWLEDSGGNLLFESDDATEVVQFAVDYRADEDPLDDWIDDELGLSDTSEESDSK